MIPHLVIVTGPPAAGKTTLGRRLAIDLGLPFFYKDGIKETLHDSLGGTTVEESVALGRASFALLFHVAGAVLAAGRSCMVEANFGPASTSGFERLQAAHAFRPVQIYCTAPPEVILRRYRERAERGERHAAHIDLHRMDELECRLMESVHRPLDLTGPLISVENVAEVDYASLLAQVRMLMESVAPTSFR